MSKTISLGDFPPEVRKHLEVMIEDAQTIVFIRDQRPVAEFRPLPPLRSPEELAEILRSLPHLSPEEAEAFGNDIDEARRAADQIPLADPWQS